MFSYCPQCGHKQSNIGNVRPFSCEVCDFTLYQNTAAAVAAIIESEGQVLFTRRAKNPAKGKLDLPGGFVDPNESLEQALSREIQEELGYQVHSNQQVDVRSNEPADVNAAWHYLGSWPNIYHYRDVNYHTCDAVFYCQLAAKPNLTIDPDEISHFEWIPLHDILISDIAFLSLQQAMQRFIKWRFAVG